MKQVLGKLLVAFSIAFACHTDALARTEAGDTPIAPDAAARGEAKPQSNPPAAEIDAASAAAKGVRVIEINGHIQPSLVFKLRTALKDTDSRRFPAGALLLLNSGGGDGIAAMEIGRLARAAKAHTFVRGRCASACVFIFAGGVVRSSPAGRAAVGIHRPRLTGFVKGLGVVDINTASNQNAANALEVSNRLSEVFLREMDMPDALYKAMMATPSEQMRYLDAAELSALGLAGFDAAYREARAPAAAARYGVSAQEFVQRTMSVQDKCLAEKTTAHEFVQCYRRVLQTGE